MSNVAVIIVKVIFISAFLFYCLLLNHSFQTNPNRITNCFKLFSILQLYQLHLLNASFKGKIVRQGAVSALAVVALVRSSDDKDTQQACIKALYNLLDARNEMDRMVDEGIVGALTTIGSSDAQSLILFAVGK